MVQICCSSFIDSPSTSAHRIGTPEMFRTCLGQIVFCGHIFLKQVWNSIPFYITVPTQRYLCHLSKGTRRTKAGKDGKNGLDRHTADGTLPLASQLGPVRQRRSYQLLRFSRLPSTSLRMILSHCISSVYYKAIRLRCIVIYTNISEDIYGSDFRYGQFLSLSIYN